MKNDCCIWYKDVCGLYNTEECTRKCIRYMEMSTLCSLAKIPKIYNKPLNLQTFGLDKVAYDVLYKIKDDIFNWVQEGENLYIYSSSTGNGKTSWAVKLMLAYFDVIWSGNGFECRGVYLPVQELIMAYRGKFGEILGGIDQLCIKNSDLVIFDDVGISAATPFEHQIILNYVESRLSNCKSCIFTSNVDYAGLVKSVGERLASRIWNNSTHIEFKDLDKRGILE